MQQYSHSPNTLSLKKNHAWFYSRPIEVGADGKAAKILFFACFAYFEPESGSWKCGKPGSPELWFIMGTVAPPPAGNWASKVQEFFELREKKHYKTEPQLGGAVADYLYKGEDSEWRAVILGHELAAIASAADLKAKAIGPLVAAAREAIIR